MDVVFGGDGGCVSLYMGVYEFWICMGVVGVVYYVVFFGFVLFVFIGWVVVIKFFVSYDLVLMGCVIFFVFGFFLYLGFNYYM